MQLIYNETKQDFIAWWGYTSLPSLQIVSWVNLSFYLFLFSKSPCLKFCLAKEDALNVDNEISSLAEKMDCLIVIGTNFDQKIA